MHRSNTHHHHGIVIGLLLALGAAVIGFLAQAGLAKAVSLNEKHFIVIAVMLVAAMLLLLKARSR
jgi:hypothetical protein